MRQVFCGGSASINSATRYYFVEGWTAAGTTVQQYAQNMIAESGTLNNLQVKLTAAPGAGTSRTFTVMLDGVATALTVTISDAATTASDTTHSVSVTAGQRIGLRGTVSGATAATAAYWGSDYVPTTAQRAVWGSSTTGNIGSTAATRYDCIGATGQNAFVSTTAAATPVPWGIHATITALYCWLDTAPGAGNSWAFTIYKNGVSQGTSTVTIADPATTGSVTGLSIVIAPTDVLCIESVPISGPTGSNLVWGISYTPTTDGQWNVSGASINGDYGDGNYAPLNSGQDADNATENLRYIGGDAAGTDSDGWTLNDLYVTCSVAPGVGQTRTYTVRKSGVDAIAATISGTNTSATGTGSATLTTADFLSIRLNKSGSAAAALIHGWTFTRGSGVATPSASSTRHLALLGAGT